MPLGTTKSRIRAGVKALRARLAPLVAAGLFVMGLTMAGLYEIDRQDEALEETSAEGCTVCPLCGAIVASDGTVLG